jgi:putative cell wall-binding protein
MNKKHLLLYFCILIMSFSVVLTEGKAEANSLVKFEDNHSTKNILDLSTEVSNDIKSSIKITKDGSTLFQDEVVGAKFEELHTLKVQDKTFLLLSKRVDGTSSALQFSILEYTNNSINEVYVSNDLLKGTLFDISANKFSIEHARYSENDSMVSPTYKITDTFTVDSTGKLSKAENKVTEYKKEEKTFSSMSASEPASSMAENSDLTIVEKIALTIKGENPSPAELNALLTRKAIENGIPPEILKAIAYQESTWNQYRSDGTPVVSFDHWGIGLMQITNRNLPESEIRRLMTDIEYNIDKGIEILLNKWDYANYGIIPKVNNSNKSNLEDWYFAIIAYNGISKVNDPNLYSTTYQERIYKHIENYSLINPTPVPNSALKDLIYYNPGGSRMYFKKDHVSISGPFHKSVHHFEEDALTLVIEDRVNLRTSPETTSSNIAKVVNQGEILKVSGAYQFDNSKYNHFPWYPVRMLGSDKVYYLSGSYLKEINIGEGEFRFDITGYGRYDTSAKIAQFGWENGSDTVVLARGDLAVDGLTGSVLAKYHNAPLLLTKSDEISSSVLDRIKDLDPTNIIVLGGKAAISNEVVETIKATTNASFQRITGFGRYSTAANIAAEIGNTDEFFIATGDESKPDALAIGPVAAKRNSPILLSDGKNGLTSSSIEILKKNPNAKVYIIGSTGVVPSKVEDQLKGIGIASDNINRVAGEDRYRTSIEIAKRFVEDPSKIVFANGESFIDALPGSPFAAMMEAPIILTKSDSLIYPVEKWIQNDVSEIPQIYFLGGNTVITEKARADIQRSILEKY